MMQKKLFGCIKNYYLNMLFEVFIISYHITMHRFVKIHINTPNYVYDKIFELKH
jgi:hypothetical protein